jgi:hypothetical protein
MDLVFVALKFLVGNPVLAINVFVLATFVANFLAALWFYKKLLGRKVAAVGVALIFACSPIVFYQSRSHLDLMQVWVVFPLLSLLLYDAKKKTVKTGAYIALITFVSNYYGFGAILLTTIVYLLKTVSQNKRGQSLKTLLLIYLFVGIFSAPFLFPYIRANYFAKTMPVTAGDSVVVRSLADFSIFSSRPWFYFMPSTDNPFFGGVSAKALSLLQAHAGWIAQPYFPSEHSASFLGLTNFVFAIAGVIFLKKQGKRQLTPVGISAIILALFTMPPYFTIHGLKIFLPSYVLFYAFPMFRVLARFGVYILAIELMFTGFGFVSLTNFLERKFAKNKAWGAVILVPAITLSLMEFYIPIKITKVQTPPQVYTYIKNATAQNSVIAVYPENETTQAIFWTLYTRQPLSNPYQLSYNGFSAGDFTKSLITNEGIEKAKQLGVNYLVYFKNKDKHVLVDQQFFDTNLNLIKVKEFTSNSPSDVNTGILSSFVRISDVGDTKDTSAILYQIK